MEQRLDASWLKWRQREAATTENEGRVHDRARCIRFSAVISSQQRSAVPRADAAPNKSSLPSLSLSLLCPPSPLFCVARDHCSSRSTESATPSLGLPVTRRSAGLQSEKTGHVAQLLLLLRVSAVCQEWQQRRS